MNAPATHTSTAPMRDWADVRADFPILERTVNGKAVLIKSTSWRLDANQREMVFFHTPPGTGRVLAKHLLSTRPEPAKPAP